MSNNSEKDARTADALVDVLMNYVDGATPAEIEELAGVGEVDRAAIVASARAKLADVRKQVAAQRRAAVRRRMDAAASAAAPDVSQMMVADLEAVFAAHVANDQASSTMAARHEKGEMDEAELRSIVADILRLRLME